jgi:hypothetical protein
MAAKDGEAHCDRMQPRMFGDGRGDYESSENVNDVVSVIYLELPHIGR